MDWLSGLFNIVNKFIPDKTEQLKAQEEISSYASQNQLAQAGIDNTEALSSSVFVSGWRPFIGWQCGVYLAWVKFLNPFFIYYKLDAFVIASDPLMIQLTFALLGVAWVSRSFEKSRGVA